MDGSVAEPRWLDDESGSSFYLKTDPDPGSQINEDMVPPSLESMNDNFRVMVTKIKKISPQFIMIFSSRLAGYF